MANIALVEDDAVAEVDTSSIFERNLAFAIKRIAGDKAEPALQMLQTEFPEVRDFQELRSIASAFVANDCRPLRREPIPAAVDPEALTGEAKLRFHNGVFYLGEKEALIFRGEEAHGPYARSDVNMMKKRLGAESVTNDRKGHIVDPEEVPVRPVMSSDEIV
jgi:hypothetical protein